MKRRCRAALILLLVSGGALAVTEEIIKLPSKDEAVQPYLLSIESGREYQTAAVLFTGGVGDVGLLRRGIPHPGGNFLVRSRLMFLDMGIATAVIDAPSDTGWMSDGYRMSKRHFKDVAAVVLDLKRRLPNVRVFLIGTSRGTVSAGYAGAALAKELAGVVLTSSVFNASGGGSGLSGFDYAEVGAPLLFVHHFTDGCFVTPYRTALQLSQSFPLITVKGGSEPKSGPCDPFSPHGYFGKEEATVKAISNWMLGRPYDAVVE